MYRRPASAVLALFAPHRALFAVPLHHFTAVATSHNRIPLPISRTAS